MPGFNFLANSVRFAIPTKKEIIAAKRVRRVMRGGSKKFYKNTKSGKKSKKNVKKTRKTSKKTKKSNK
jgi:hypothetical protein